MRRFASFKSDPNAREGEGEKCRAFPSHCTLPQSAPTMPTSHHSTIHIPLHIWGQKIYPWLQHFVSRDGQSNTPECSQARDKDDPGVHDSVGSMNSELKQTSRKIHFRCPVPTKKLLPSRRIYSTILCMPTQKQVPLGSRPLGGYSQEGIYRPAVLSFNTTTEVIKLLSRLRRLHRKATCGSVFHVVFSYSTKHQFIKAQFFAGCYAVLLTIQNAFCAARSINIPQRFHANVYL